jgi:hypothetical protein
MSPGSREKMDLRLGLLLAFLLETLATREPGVVEW